MTRHQTVRTVCLVVAAALASGSALAGDPKPPAPAPAKDAVEVKLAAKPGTTLRFRHVESSASTVNEKPRSGKDLLHEYSVTVKAARPDGGLDVELRYELVRGKFASRIGGPPREFDSAQPIPADADDATKLMISLATAMVAKPLAVTLDAHGAVVAVKGLRELWMEKIKGTKFESAFNPDEDFSDAKNVDEIAPLFCASPAEPHVVGTAWTADVKDRIDTADMVFAAKFAVSIADAEQITVGGKLDWKPPATATADGAKASGGGTYAATISRKDGFVVSLTKDLKATRDTGPMHAESHASHTIERLEAPPAPAPKPKKK